MIQPNRIFRISMLNRLPFGALLLTNAATGLLTACATTPAAYRDELKSGVEEIYIFRTIRTQRTPGATPTCAAAPFTSAREDHYALWSIEPQAADARVTDTHRSNVGEFTACFGTLAKDQPLPMYATGTIAKVPWTGVGECTLLKAQPPVKTALAFSCNLTLGGLPEAYASGSAISSTLSPLLGQNADPGAHVPGYLSTSVVTIRLWKKVL
jgi:hypothetical protein